MYNSINLPLSPRKVIKKSVARILALLPVILGFGLPIAFLIFARSFNVTSQNPIHPSALLPTVLSWLIGLFLLGIILSVIYEYLYYRLYYYNFTEDGAEIRKGVISRATGHVRYNRLQNIYVDQDILDRIFGLYDVHYETAGESSGFYSHVDGLNQENANKLRDFLLAQSRPTEQPASTPATDSVGPAVPTIAVPPGEISTAQYPMQTSWPLASALKLLVFFGIVFALFSLGNSAVIVSLVLLPLFFILCLVNYVWYRNFRFRFDEKGGEIRTKVIGQSTTYVYYDRVQNATVTQGIIDRFFGLCNISLDTAGERSGLLLNLRGYSAADAEAIKNFLLERVALYKAKL